MSKKSIRLTIGILGMMLPFVLLIFNRTGDGERYFEASISEFYYTSIGDVFVAYMVAFGSFMIVHAGNNLTERILSTIAGVSAILIAFFPTGLRYQVNLLSVHAVKPVVSIAGVELHLIFALIFFTCLAIITCLYYSIVAGYIIIGCLIALVIFFSINAQLSWPFVFILESIAIEAFGIAWVRKAIAPGT